jgi:hypothetical protein
MSTLAAQASHHTSCMSTLAALQASGRLQAQHQAVYDSAPTPWTYYYGRLQPQQQSLSWSSNPALTATPFPHDTINQPTNGLCSESPAQYALLTSTYA